MSVLLLAAALVAPTAMPPASAPTLAAQDRWRGVNGNNVTRVFHTGGGSFEQLENNRWVEFGDEGTLIHQFDEQGRDVNSVSLIDRSRGGVRVVINLRTGEITGAPAFGSWRLLYRITDVDSDRRGRGWRGRRGGNGGNGGYGNGGGRGDDGWGSNGTRTIEVGPIWNQRDAEQKCRQKANDLRLEWTGGWWTTVQGRMSVCEMRRDSRGGGYGNGGGGGGGGYGNGGGGYGGGVVREFEVGPLWNQRDAEQKCRQKANELRGEWTGQWRTTIQGRMSVCEIRLR